MKTNDLPLSLNLTNTIHGAVTIPVGSSTHASRALSTYRDTHGICASHMIPGFGEVTDADGHLVVRVSYNGRVWDAINNGREIHVG